MKNFFPLCFLIVFLNSCQNEPVFNPLEYNSNLTIKQNLVNGVSVLEILNFNEISSFYGIEYEGGFIYHVDTNNG